jgi:hypothetical protein
MTRTASDTDELKQLEDNFALILTLSFYLVRVASHSAKFASLSHISLSFNMLSRSFSLALNNRALSDFNDLIYLN